MKPGKWRDALPPEQKALQSLLRAEALFRNIQVAFGQQGGGGGGGGGAQRDLARMFDLELDTTKNQYETGQQSEAEKASAQQKAIDDAFERLKELGAASTGTGAAAQAAAGVRAEMAAGAVAARGRRDAAADGATGARLTRPAAGRFATATTAGTARATRTTGRLFELGRKRRAIAIADERAQRSTGWTAESRNDDRLSIARWKPCGVRKTRCVRP